MKEITIRTIPQPADLNINGNIFGGWVLSQMDIAGGVVGARVAKGAVATVAIESMKFVNPIEVGDVINIYTEVTKIGRTSITIAMEVVAERGARNIQKIKVTEATMIFVAIDEQGNKRKIPTVTGG